MTPLESILSNLVHCPMKLVGIEIPQMSGAIGVPPEFEWKLTTVPDLGSLMDEEIPFCDMDCENCEEDCKEDPPMMWGIPDIDYVIFNGPATIVFWGDGTKTVVKCMKGEKFERYAGFMAACMKKMFGSTSRAKAIMNECCVDEGESNDETPSE